MPAEVTIRFRGTRQQAIAAIRRAANPKAANGDKFRTLLVRIGLIALENIHQAYATKADGGTDEAGVTWPPLAPSTIRRRLRKPSYKVHGGIPILRDTDALYESLEPAVDGQEASGSPPSIPGQVFRLEQDAVVMGSEIPYAIFHERGIPGKMPARPPIPAMSTWPSSWWDDILTEATLGFVEILKKELGR